jgi:hypothetical protein
MYLIFARLPFLSFSIQSMHACQNYLIGYTFFSHLHLMYTSHTVRILLDNDFLETKEYTLDPNYKDPTQIPSENNRTPLLPTKLSDFNCLHRRLNARDRRKLLVFKGEKLTLEQTRPQFAHLDTAFLC